MGFRRGHQKTYKTSRVRPSVAYLRASRGKLLRVINNRHLHILLVFSAGKCLRSYAIVHPRRWSRSTTSSGGLVVATQSALIGLSRHPEAAACLSSSYPTARARVRIQEREGGVLYVSTAARAFVSGLLFPQNPQVRLRPSPLQKRCSHKPLCRLPDSDQIHSYRQADISVLIRTSLPSSLHWRPGLKVAIVDLLTGWLFGYSRRINVRCRSAQYHTVLLL